MNELLSDIEEGKYVSGQALPTEDELSKVYSVSRTSIRNSLKALQAKDIIFKRRGSGNYVKEKPVEAVLEKNINLGVLVNLHEDEAKTGILEVPFIQSIMRGMKSAIDTEGANFMMSMYHWGSDNPGEEICSGYKVDGFLDMGNTISASLNGYFETSQSKVVSILPQHNVHMFKYLNPLVILDETEGIKDALRFYRKQGYSKFGFVGLAENGLRNYRMFQDVFQPEGAFFDNSSIIIHPESTANMTNLWERIKDIADNILNNKMEPDVFFFDGGKVADYLIKLLLEKQTGIEKRIKFCILGGSPGEKLLNSEYFDFIQHQPQKAGKAAVELLLEYIKNGKVDKDRVSVPSIFVNKEICNKII
jgi:DNA-binding LacI/PurR family transcriptional regulator